MYQTEYEPTDTGAVLTTGAIGKLANAAADTRALVAKTKAALADIERRVERLEREKAVAASPRLILESQP
jgi:hypothetical protein